MTVREGWPPVGLLCRLLLFDDVDHPRYAIPIAHFTETMSPEGFLPVHFDFSVCCQVIKPAFAFVDVLRVEYQRKARVVGISVGGAIAHHDVAARNAQVGVGNGGIGEFHA